jgi:uncharacterized protein (TIGR02246 family)
MKRLGIVLSLFIALAAHAQAPDESVHQAPRQLKTTMSNALNNGDVDTIVANVTPNVVFTTMNGDVCRGPAQIRAYFQKMMTAPGHVVKKLTVSFDADALTILYGGDTGIAYGSSNDHYDLTDGGKFDIRGRWSCTLVREGNRWLIANFHYSANVFNNPILERTRMYLIGAAIAAGIIGLLLGWFLGRRARKA